MYEQILIGVLHPEVVIRDVDLLFYDQLHLIEPTKPTNPDSELLFECGILSNVEDEIDLDGQVLKEKCPDSVSLIHTLNKQISQCEYAIRSVGINTSIEEAMQLPFPRYAYLQTKRTQEGFIALVRHELHTPKAQAYAVLASDVIGNTAIPIIPTGHSDYSTFVSGYAMNIINVPVPKIPIRDLISFKYDNQDKLRRFRVAFSKLQQVTSELDEVMEEISLSLKDYRKSVNTISSQHEMTKVQVYLSSAAAWVKFLTSFDVSVFSETFSIEKSNIQKQLDLDSAKGSELSYLYEIGELFNGGKNTK